MKPGRLATSRRLALMASRAVCLSVMAASPLAGRRGRQRRRQHRRCRYRAKYTTLLTPAAWSRQPGIELIYEPTRVFERGPSLDFLEHDCTSIQQDLPWALPSGARQRLFFVWHSNFLAARSAHHGFD